MQLNSNLLSHESATHASDFRAVERKVMWGFVGAVMLISLFAAVTYRASASYTHAATRVAHTQEVRAALGDLYSTLSDAESAQRAYLLTGDQTQKKYRFGLVSVVPDELNKLAELISDNPIQQRNLSKLRSLITRRISLLDKVVQTYESRGLMEAQHEIVVSQSASLMTNIRFLTNAMEGQEIQLLKAREAESEHNRLITLIFMMITLLLAFVTMTKLFFVIRRDIQLRVTDISERRRAESLLKDSEVRYKSNESKHQMAIETSADGFWMVDTKGRILEANNAYVQQSGYSIAELLRLSVLDLEAKERHEETAAHIDTVMRLGSDRFETMHKRKDGSLWPVHVAVSYSEIDGGKFFVFLTDLSEHRQKDALLQQQSRLANLGEMIGNIAHQWRQPINSLSLILNDLEDAAEHHQCDIHYLHKSVATSNAIIQKMSGTIDDFRNFFKIDNIHTDFNLYHAVNQCLVVIEATLLHQNIAVTCECSSEVKVQGRESDFSQAFLNLLSNAKDAIAEKNHAAGQISIEISSEGNEGVVTVTDNGGGIAEQVLHKIFDPYFTSKVDGVGIGLYMSRMAIERNMNGKIEVENRGQGARFTIRLPRTN